MAPNRLLPRRARHFSCARAHIPGTGHNSRCGCLRAAHAAVPCAALHVPGHFRLVPQRPLSPPSPSDAGSFAGACAASTARGHIYLAQGTRFPILHWRHDANAFFFWEKSIGVIDDANAFFLHCRRRDANAFFLHCRRRDANAFFFRVMQLQRECTREPRRVLPG